MSLTPKQKRFVAEYLIDNNGKQAAIRAGCPARSAKVTAARWLTKANVQAALAKGQTKLADKAELTAALVLERLQTEAEREGEGSSHSARVRAWELIGRHVGMWPNKVEHSGPRGGPIPIESKEVIELTDAQLMRIAAGDDKPA